MIRKERETLRTMKKPIEPIAACDYGVRFFFDDLPPSQRTSKRTGEKCEGLVTLVCQRQI
jgi:hypothetical protein